MQNLRLYKVWRSVESEGHVLYIWAQDADEAFHKIARKIDPKVISVQWTGKEGLATKGLASEAELTILT